MDTLICGQCGVSFHDLHQFVDHKNNGCEDTTRPAEESLEMKQEDANHQEQEEEQQFVIANTDDNQEIIMDSSILVLSQDDVGQEQFKDGEVVHMEVMTDDMGYQQLVQSWPPTSTHSSSEQVEVVNWDEHMATESHQLQEQQATEQENYTANRIELVPVTCASTPGGGVDLQIMLNPPPKPPPALTKSGKRRGRPKKCDQKPKDTDSLPKETPKEVKEERPEAKKGEDGRLHCPKCKRNFARQRQYNTHICGASNSHSDYVDLSLKDVRIDLDLSEEEEEEDDVNSADPTVEYRFPHKELDSDTEAPPVKRGRGRPRKHPLVAKPKPTQLSQIIVQEVHLQNEQDQAVSQIQDQIQGDGQTVLIAELQDPSSLASLRNENRILEQQTSGTNDSQEVQKDGESDVLEVTSEAVSIGNGDGKEMSVSDNIKIRTVKLSDIQNMSDSKAETDGEKKDIKKQDIVTQLQESDLSKLEEQGVKVIKISSADISAGIPEGAVVLSDLSQKSLEEVRKTLTSQHGLNSNPRTKRTKIKVEEDTDMSKIEDLPLFTNEEDKAQFDQALNVDISCVDSLFATHIISQEMNENAYPTSTRLSDTLVVFSCSQCQRVFMSLSHARHHCLIHTDLKPFRCFRCPYATNTKGNLYNHMRRHTGQLYACPHCAFRSHNKGHLTEHVETHSATTHECRMCRKKYSTTKSLANHVKRYHGNTPRGRQYYADQFLKRRNQGATAMLHMCQVCNRKFKKQIDRDRHLLIHNIRNTNATTTTNDTETEEEQQQNLGAALFHCDLCEYVSSRRPYLQRHAARRHRVVYVCSECESMFPSATRLEQHPCALAHGSENKDSEEWHKYYESCILASKYRPLEDQQDDNEDDEEDNQVVHEPNPEMSINLEEAIKQQQQQQQQESKQSDDPSGTSQSSHQRPADRVTFLVKPSGGGEYKLKAKAAAADGKDVGDGDDMHDSLYAGYVPLTLEALQNISESLGRFECEYCGRRFAIKAEMEQHVKTHTGDKPFACEECEFRSITRENLRRHVVRHHQCAAYVCRQCPPISYSVPSSSDPYSSTVATSIPASSAASIPFSSSVATSIPTSMNTTATTQGLSRGVGGVVTELEGDQGEGELRMEQEGERLEQQGEEAQRLEQQGEDGQRLEQQREDGERMEEQHFVTFPTRSALWAHEQEVHKAGPTATVTCLQCNTTFDNQRKLKVHLAMKHPELDQEEKKKVLVPLTRPQPGQQQGNRKTVKCPYCPKVFYRANSELQKHIWIHQGVKPFKCPLCAHACRSKNNLHAHMVRHSQEKPFLCTHCGKAYKSRTALRWHVRSHTDGKIFKCNKCPYEGSQQSHLTRHLETHNIAKKYACQHCDFSANTAGYMKIHYTRFHKGQLYKPGGAAGAGGYARQTAPDAKVYKCLSCDYLFGNLSDMKRHLRVRHQVQVEDMGPLEELDTSNAVLGDAQQQQQQELQEPMQIVIGEDGQHSISGHQAMSLQATNPELLTTLTYIQHQQQGQVEVEPLLVDSHVEDGGAGEQFVIQYEQIATGQTFTEEVHIGEEKLPMEEEEERLELEVAFDNTQEVFVPQQHTHDMNMMKLVTSEDGTFHQHLPSAPADPDQHLHTAPADEHFHTAPADQHQHQHLQTSSATAVTSASIVQYETSSASYPQTQEEEQELMYQQQQLVGEAEDS